jgi:cytochrome c biogenesis protein CcmG/thiol:disulfide interchange protein DsbE
VARLRSPFAVAAIVGVAALLGLLAYGLGSAQPDRGIEGALAGGERPEAPAFELALLDDEGEQALEDYRGQVVVLNFWASWCEPCREESPLLQRWHERLSADGRGTVLGVDIDDVTSDATAFVREYGLTYPMLKQPSYDVRAEYGVAGLPETVVIDREGRITAIQRGPVDEAWMRREVLPLLDEAA